MLSGGDERGTVLAALAAARESLLRGFIPSAILDRRAMRTVLTDLKCLVIRRL